jgi:predicted GH43/DUF377 family glycosyl hydrolase
MNKLLRFLQRQQMPTSHQELYAKIHTLQETLERRDREHEDHLSDLRMERDRLFDELESISGWMDAMSESFEQDIPSVTKQTPWRCEIFDFGKAEKPGINYFNPGLVHRPDGLWLVVRRSKDWPRLTFGLNDLMAFKLEGDHIPVMGVKIRVPPMLNGEHYEDPRAVFHNGSTWVSCCNFVVYQKTPQHQTWTGAHQLLLQCNEHWNTVKRIDPIYGKNGGSPGTQLGDEKNWVWFFPNDRPHLIYMTQPHTVVPMGPFLDSKQAYVTNEINPLWTSGMPRGGTPPILVDGEYWSFFHSSTPWIGKKRRYHMGVYAFQSQPPYRITRMSSMPLLSGSKQDKWFEGKPLVVFPNGAVIKDGLWTVVFGVNDLQCGWIDIPHADLLQIVRPVAMLGNPEVVFES